MAGDRTRSSSQAQSFCNNPAPVLPALHWACSDHSGAIQLISELRAVNHGVLLRLADLGIIVQSQEVPLGAFIEV